MLVLAFDVTETDEILLNDHAAAEKADKPLLFCEVVLGKVDSTVTLEVCLLSFKDVVVTEGLLFWSDDCAELELEKVLLEETRFCLFVTDDTCAVGFWGVVSKLDVDTSLGLVFSGFVLSVEKVITEDAKLFVTFGALGDRDGDLLVSDCFGEFLVVTENVVDGNDGRLVNSDLVDEVDDLLIALDVESVGDEVGMLNDLLVKRDVILMLVICESQ